MDISQLLADFGDWAFNHRANRSPHTSTAVDSSGAGVIVLGLRRRSVLQAGACTGAAAVAGNAFIGKPAMDWFRGLTAPRWQLPLPASMAVGAAYYGIIGEVLARSIDRRDARSTAWSLAVLVGNEAWNGAFFGRRSVRAGFLGLCAFIVPLAALQRAVAQDPPARRALAIYTTFVLLYDLPWTYRLWRLNPPCSVGRPSEPLR